MANIFQILNGKILFEWLNLSLECFQMRSKELFSKWNMFEKLMSGWCYFILIYFYVSLCLIFNMFIS